jgi:hypothetical protein
MCIAVCGLAAFFGFVLGDARFHQLLDERGREWLIGGEVDGAF